jgi:hypothetical protein
MPDSDDSKLWRISDFERLRTSGRTSLFAPLGEKSMLPTTLLTELRQLDYSRNSSDVLEVAAACMRHRQPALLCMQDEDRVWPVTLFPAEGLMHTPLDPTTASAEGLAALKVLSCDPPGLRPPGHWMHERVAASDQYRPLKAWLWHIAIRGPRRVLLSEIDAQAVFRSTLPTDEYRLASGALRSAVERLHRESATLRDVAGWPGMSAERAGRLLNALYLGSNLMVMRSHPSAGSWSALVGRWLRPARRR